ncbi:MAG: pre-toxin TG domain-containing protein, partial [Moraxellaceae bacterium]|nr:pre-toxin TG domain-containing protein [Moraxellaceae bacterium]
MSQGDTLASIARMIWGDSRMWYLIADANGLAVGANDPLEAGETLRIPAVAGSSKNNATTFKPYDPSDIIGETSPNPKAPPPPKPPKKKCGGLGAIVMVVVAVVAVVVTAGAAAVALGATGGGLFASGGAALVGGSLGTVSMSFGTALGASIIGGAVGSAISQGIGMAMGVVDKFSWRQVAAGGIGAGLTAGLGHFGQFAQITEGMKWSQAASAYARNAAMSYSVNQLSGRVAGLDTSFSWRSVASTVVGATVGNAAGRGLGLDGGNLWSGVARSVVTGSSQSYFNQQWARGGKLDFVQLAMDSFGNALGNDIVGRMTPAATAVPVTLAKNGQRAMDMDGVNFLDAGVDTSMPDMRWIDDLNTSIATGSNLAVNANTPGYTATVSVASQTAVAGGYQNDPGMGTQMEITYNPNEQVMPEVAVTASAKESGGGLLSWLRKPENISFVLDMVPVVGTLKSLYQAGAGRDLITGEAVNR